MGGCVLKEMPTAIAPRLPSAAGAGVRTARGAARPGRGSFIPAQVSEPGLPSGKNCSRILLLALVVEIYLCESAF